MLLQKIIFVLTFIIIRFVLYLNVATMNNSQILLKDVAVVRFGLYLKPEEKGNVLYMQAKNFDDLACIHIKGDSFLSLDDKNNGHLLKEGDVLFVGKGFRNFAWAYDSSVGDAIASSIFYVIRCNQALACPNYIATLFNSQKYQSQFQSLGAGSSIPSIRKAELENLIIDLPPLALQQKIAKINALHIEDIKLSNQVIELKKKVFENIINRIIK